jgi:hypothetical protein
MGLCVHAFMRLCVNAACGKIKTHQRINASTLSPLRLRASPFLFALVVLHSLAAGQDNAKNDDQGYRIDKPGTITFTVGVKIKGKVEKPQVVIFLPKEKPSYRDIAITHSFLSDIMEPLPLKPEEK